MIATESAALNVYVNNLLVGHLIKMKSGGMAFSYDKNWLAMPEARPLSLSLPLVADYYEGDLVYNFFDNLLPDNVHIRTRIQKLFQIPSSHPFDLLASIGHDCVGAIQLYKNHPDSDIQSITADPLSNEEIAELLKNYRQAPLGMIEAKDFRISIAGAQEKTALLWRHNQWHRPRGATPTTHIFKLPIGIIEHQGIDLRNSCENEWLCYKIAEAFGLPVAPAEILHFNEVKALVVQRFDRQVVESENWILRLLQEDMCQALGYSPALKYQADGGPGIQNIMSLLLSSEQAATDRKRFFQYQVLFWLLGAIDGHAKNFSVFINAKGRFCLTPLYDVMSAYPLITNKQLQRQKIKMAMALKGAKNHYYWHNIQHRHFLLTAKSTQFSVEEARNIIDTMLQQIELVIKNVSAQLDDSFPELIAGSIFQGMLNFRDRISTI